MLQAIIFQDKPISKCPFKHASVFSKSLPLEDQDLAINKLKMNQFKEVYNRQSSNFNLPSNKFKQPIDVKQNQSPVKKIQRFQRKPDVSITVSPKFSRQPMKHLNQQLIKSPRLIGTQQANIEVKSKLNLNTIQQKQNNQITIQTKYKNLEAILTHDECFKQSQQKDSQVQNKFTIFSHLKNSEKEQHKQKSSSVQQTISSGNTSDQYSLYEGEDQFLTSFNQRFAQTQQNKHQNDKGDKIQKQNVYQKYQQIAISQSERSQNIKNSSHFYKNCSLNYTNSIHQSALHKKINNENIQEKELNDYNRIENEDKFINCDKKENNIKIDNKFEQNNDKYIQKTGKMRQANSDYGNNNLLSSIDQRLQLINQKRNKDIHEEYQQILEKQSDNQKVNSSQSIFKWSKPNKDQFVLPFSQKIQQQNQQSQLQNSIQNDQQFNDQYQLATSKSEYTITQSELSKISIDYSQHEKGNHFYKEEENFPKQIKQNNNYIIENQDHFAQFSSKKPNNQQLLFTFNNRAPHHTVSINIPSPTNSHKNIIIEHKLGANTQFYQSHMNKLDNLIVQILQMKKSFQLYYLSDINRQVNQNQIKSQKMIKRLQKMMNRMEYNCNKSCEINNLNEISNNMVKIEKLTANDLINKTKRDKKNLQKRKKNKQKINKQYEQKQNEHTNSDRNIEAQIKEDIKRVNQINNSNQNHQQHYQNGTQQSQTPLSLMGKTLFQYQNQYQQQINQPNHQNKYHHQGQSQQNTSNEQLKSNPNSNVQILNAYQSIDSKRQVNCYSSVKRCNSFVEGKNYNFLQPILYRNVIVQESNQAQTSSQKISTIYQNNENSLNFNPTSIITQRNRIQCEQNKQAIFNKPHSQFQVTPACQKQHHKAPLIICSSSQNYKPQYTYHSQKEIQNFRSDNNTKLRSLFVDKNKQQILFIRQKQQQNRLMQEIDTIFKKNRMNRNNKTTNYKQKYYQNQVQYDQQNQQYYQDSYCVNDRRNLIDVNCRNYEVNNDDSQCQQRIYQGQQKQWSSQLNRIKLLQSLPCIVKVIDNKKQLHKAIKGLDQSKYSQLKHNNSSSIMVEHVNSSNQNNKQQQFCRQQKKKIQQSNKLTRQLKQVRQLNKAAQLSQQWSQTVTQSRKSVRFQSVISQTAQQRKIKHFIETFKIQSLSPPQQSYRFNSQDYKNLSKNIKTKNQLYLINRNQYNPLQNPKQVIQFQQMHDMTSKEHLGRNSFCMRLKDNVNLHSKVQKQSQTNSNQKLKQTQQLISSISNSNLNKNQFESFNVNLNSCSLNKKINTHQNYSSYQQQNSSLLQKHNQFNKTQNDASHQILSNNLSNSLQQTRYYSYQIQRPSSGSFNSNKISTIKQKDTAQSIKGNQMSQSHSSIDKLKSLKQKILKQVNQAKTFKQFNHTLSSNHNFQILGRQNQQNIINTTVVNKNITDYAQNMIKSQTEQNMQSNQSFQSTVDKTKCQNTISFNKRLKQGRICNGETKKANLKNSINQHIHCNSNQESSRFNQSCTVQTVNVNQNKHQLSEQTIKNHSPKDIKLQISQIYLPKPKLSLKQQQKKYQQQKKRQEQQQKKFQVQQEMQGSKTKYSPSPYSRIQILPNSPIFNSIYYDRTNKQMFKYKWLKWK